MKYKTSGATTWNRISHFSLYISIRNYAAARDYLPSIKKQLQGMGGCCSSSKKQQLHGTPVYYYCPSVSEDQDPLTSSNGMTPAIFLVDVNLETSFRDTYRAPPTPLPYDMVFGHPLSVSLESVRGISSGNGFPSLATREDLEVKDFTTPSSLPESPNKTKISTFNEPDTAPTEEEDCCPVCLEEYDSENPRTIAKCQHHFHLSCILEWMERSTTCAICDQDMIVVNTIS